MYIIEELLEFLAQINEQVELLYSTRCEIGVTL
jgi:hypothetical protein